jgi:alcohol dehydrogenase YqhD (iron-dependent ADH family)
LLAVWDSRYALTAQIKAHAVNPKASRSLNAFVGVGKEEDVETGFDVGGGSTIVEDDGVVNGCTAAEDAEIVGDEGTVAEDAVMVGIPATVVTFPTVAGDAAEDGATATICMEEESNRINEYLAFKPYNNLLAAIVGVDIVMLVFRLREFCGFET